MTMLFPISSVLILKTSIPPGVFFWGGTVGIEELRRRQSRRSEDQKREGLTKQKADELSELLSTFSRTIDDLVPTVFPSAVYVDSRTSADPYGYRWIIKGRPLTKSQHKKVCTFLLTEIIKVSKWLKDNCSDPRKVISKARKEVIKQLGSEWCDSERSPLFALEILDDMASGRSEHELLPELMAINVKTMIHALGWLREPVFQEIGLLPVPKSIDIPTLLTESSPDADLYRSQNVKTEKHEWCTAKFAKRRFSLSATQLHKAYVAKIFGISIDPPKRISTGKGKRTVQVFLFKDLERLSSEREKKANNKDD